MWSVKIVYSDGVEDYVSLQADEMVDGKDDQWVGRWDYKTAITVAQSLDFDEAEVTSIVLVNRG